MYILEDRTPSFRTSIAGKRWRTEEILDDMKKCGHGVQTEDPTTKDKSPGQEPLSTPEKIQPEQSTSQFISSNSANTENLSNTSRPRLIENEDRLPGAVLLARARLLERLRGVPLSANRGSGRPLSDCPELTLEDDLRELVDDRDLGTQASAGQSAGGSSITSLTSRIERLQLLLKPKKKPPGRLFAPGGFQQQGWRGGIKSFTGGRHAYTLAMFP
ncbi:hypothetical protein SO802_030086 [Lithocarpus litseifolius]|uniref:Uncharacterized protein n=1 Tax=Lithocarpus litseifolius TaxID=425828 RepID=A0AAW2BVI1_9ROSI